MKSRKFLHLHLHPIRIVLYYETVHFSLLNYLFPSPHHALRNTFNFFVFIHFTHHYNLPSTQSY